MSKKIRVGILFGGRSTEHEISLLSAQNIIAALATIPRFETYLIGVQKNGAWGLYDSVAASFQHPQDPSRITLSEPSAHLAWHMQGTPWTLVNTAHPTLSYPLDVVFPVIHGTGGEDGSLQGLLQLANLPYVGATPLSSAINMNKDVTKRLLEHAGIAIPKFLTVQARHTPRLLFSDIERLLGVPFFLRPVSLGSSVGVAKIRTPTEFQEKMSLALEFDHQLILEECIVGREMECSVLGNDDPIASLPGEVIPQHDFYSYEAKYLDPNGALLKIPALGSEQEKTDLQNTAIRAYQALNCQGMARVDMFLTQTGQVVLNELNTLPGFTPISMYPKLWEISGLPYTQLIERLIELALERFQREQTMRSSY